MKRVYFFYPKGEKLTGQELASKLILESLGSHYDFEINHFPAFNRNGSFFYKLFYFVKVLKSWLNIFSLVFAKSPKVYVNIGQTYLSLVRDGLPFRILSFFKPSAKFVISLHGHVFTTWNGDERVCRSFISLLIRAGIITVLGEVQKEKLVSLGIDEKVVRIIPNSCELSAASGEKKHESLNLLYLSNLIEEKGYKEYLQALKLLSSKINGKTKVNAILCGSLYEGDNYERTEIIGKIIDKINSTGNINVSWIKGAYGDDKRKLFENADIFVFPSKYKVEAQPIVLIEAMASGCAIITTNVGEIPSTVSEENAFVLLTSYPQRIAEKLNILLEDADLLDNMQTASIKRFNIVFSLDVYSDNWCQIFEDI